jgi:hypothetical protein
MFPTKQDQTMKTLKSITSAVLVSAYLAAPLAILAADAKDEKKPEKAKPYTLKTCPVSDEKLGGMGDPYVFTYQDREIKLCCKDCKKDFEKNPKKFIKKIEDAEKKSAKK